MSSRRRSIVYPARALMATAGAIAFTAATFAAVGALSAAHADSVSVARAPEALGVGENVIVVGPEQREQRKIPVAGGTSVPAVMTTPPARAKAPVPVPQPVKRPKAAAKPRAAVAPSRAAEAGGWQSARASWYGPGFYGRRTASGAVLTENMMNVAHKTLPFGTQVQFEYRGRVVTAVVNDRGPHIAGRVWDLGPGTAQALGFSGVATVNYRILGR